MQPAEADRAGKLLQRRQRLAVIVAIHVGDDIAGPLVRLQVLAQDVQPRIRQGAVQFGQHARLVAVDVQQSVRARHLGQLHVGQVDAEGGVAPVQIAQQPLGRELGDGFLCLFGRAADVRG